MLHCLTKVWASKWNERAYFSTRKVKLDHDYLCMAVLVQEIISADYAFVIHTTNPSSGDSSEIYAEVSIHVPMDEEEKVVLDYVSDPLIMDKNFCSSILSSIARAGHAIEELYGSPQDIEGVVKDGKIFVVQTRPQM
ncbi:hypothetical protein GW17_00032267 [Ensete ventricosum]|nr:hypothetical protein GW17_00032267 [Ensete ventricosum]